MLLTSKFEKLPPLQSSSQSKLYGSIVEYPLSLSLVCNYQSIVTSVFVLEVISYVSSLTGWGRMDEKKVVNAPNGANKEKYCV